MRIPGSQDWAGYEADLDVTYAYNLMFGKSIDEVLPHFRRNPIERADELLFMPAPAFRYYVFAFVKYVMSADAAGDSDVASSFLSLIFARINRDPVSVLEIMDDLTSCLDYIAENQLFFEASVDIYGDFQVRRDEIERIRRRLDARG